MTQAIANLGNLDTMMMPAAVFGLWLTAFRQWRVALAFASALLLVAAITALLKLYFSTPGQTLWSDHAIISQYFPSGHASLAVALYVSVGVIVARAGGGSWRLAPLGAMVCAAMVAADRVLTRTHPIGDVIGGLAIGCVAPLLVGLVVRRRHGLPPAAPSLVLFCCAVTFSLLFPLPLHGYLAGYQ